MDRDCVHLGCVLGISMDYGCGPPAAMVLLNSLVMFLSFVTSIDVSADETMNEIKNLFKK